VLEREPVGVDDLALYPLFDDALLALMRRLIAPDKQDAVGVAIVVRARCGTTAASVSAGDRALTRSARPS
jgi:hypothetical protein